jgi:hypothetical protein
VPGLYDVDRLDLSANSTLNGTAQAAVSRFLVSLNTPEGAKAVGMFGKNLLNPDNDLSKIIYSFYAVRKHAAGRAAAHPGG